MLYDKFVNHIHKLAREWILGWLEKGNANSEIESLTFGVQEEAVRKNC